MVSGRGEDHKKEERRGSSRRTKTLEIRRASVGGQPRVDGGNRTGTARTRKTQSNQVSSGQVSHDPEAGPLVRVMWGENPSRSPSHYPNLEVKSSACWQGLRPPPESQQKQCQLSDVRIQAARTRARLAHFARFARDKGLDDAAAGTRTATIAA
jgi:hypothetical protein